MGLNLIRSYLKRDYSPIPNDLVNDDSIPLESRFLFILLATQSEEWKFRTKWLLKKMGIKDPKTLAKYWHVLEASGWAIRTRERQANGRWGRWTYTLFPYPGYQITTEDEDTEPAEEEPDTRGGKSPAGPEGDFSPMDKTPSLNNTKSKNNTKSPTDVGDKAAAAKDSDQVDDSIPSGLRLLRDPEHMKQANHDTARKVQLLYPEITGARAQDIATMALMFRKLMVAEPNNVTHTHWAISEAINTYEYWERQNWGRGKTAKTQLKNQVADWRATIRNRFTERNVRAIYTRPGPRHPDFGKPQWQRDAEPGTVPDNYESPLNRHNKTYGSNEDLAAITQQFTHK